jgi:hypothetical protein
MVAHDIILLLIYTITLLPSESGQVSFIRNFTVDLASRRAHFEFWRFFTNGLDRRMLKVYYCTGRNCASI